MTIRFNENRQAGQSSVKESNEFLLMPSKFLFQKINEDVSMSTLNQNVFTLILSREKLLEEIQLKAFTGDASKFEREMPDMLHKLHSISISVVEAIIASESFNDYEEYKNLTTKKTIGGKDGKVTFLWKGENYLRKMLSDLQFMHLDPKMKDILNMYVNGKTLHRNPFLLPLNVDDIMCSNISMGMETKMAGVPWKIEMHKIEKICGRILSEEMQSHHGDVSFIEVADIREASEDVVELIMRPPPSLNIEKLRQIAQSSSLVHDDALLLFHVWLIMCADKSHLELIQKKKIDKTYVDTLVRTELEDILRRLDTSKTKPREQFFSRNSIVWIHSMILHHLLKLELLHIKSSESLVTIKMWLLSIVTRQFRLSSTKINVDKLFSSSQDCTENKIVSTSLNKFTRKDPTLSPISNSAIFDEEKKSIKREPTLCTTTSKRDIKRHMTNECVSLPIWCTGRIAEGECKLQITGGKDHHNILPGDKIRIGHPLHSYSYSVGINADTSINNDCIQIIEPFDYSPTLNELSKERDYTIELLHDPHFKINQESDHRVKFDPLISSTILNSCSQAIIKQPRNHLKSSDIRGKLHFMKIRFWKLIKVESDRRLQWRKDFDNGSVPWYDLPPNTVKNEHFRVKVDISRIESDCFDSICNPHCCIHQQRLQYFEKVHLDDIMVETYKTVCNWHPISSSIDIFKWAKLARGMKFLSTVKNANHELDMAFLRHSNDRTLDLIQFKSVLLDMASLKFPSSRYESREALANMLWKTVAILPAVNKMIWKKAQQLALNEEILRVCAQIRISARFRMICKLSIHRRKRIAAIDIQAQTRRMLWYEQRKRNMLLAMYDRLYRLRYISSILCQKYWRRYVKRRQFGIWKMQRKRMLQEARARRRKKMQIKFSKKMRPVLCRKIVKIQSVLTITWIVLRDRRIVGGKVELEIQVYVPQDRQTSYFKLDENDTRMCFEKEILRVGPLTWDQMLEPGVISQLINRLSIQSIGNRITVAFNKSGIVERGDLIENRILPIRNVKFVLSLYRTPISIAIRLYDPLVDHMLRYTIDSSILCEWLIEYQHQERTGVSNVLQFWEISQKKKNCALRGEELIDKEFKELERELGGDFPEILKKSKESDLIDWLVDKIDFREKEDEFIRRELILQYELEVERIEWIVRKVQCVWRGKAAKNKVKEKVHLQYEKHFDRESRSFFYVHTRTGQKQWSKPTLLADKEDISRPPDEWREAEYIDPESKSSHKYYFNPFTGQSSWLSEEHAAQIVQRKFRKRQTQELLNTNIKFEQVVQVVKFVTDVEAKFEENPTKLSHIVNFALLNHCLKFKEGTAKALYRDAVSKSPYHPIIARAYGIFSLSICEVPLIRTFEKACQSFEEADAIDPSGTKFKAATENFFYWSVVMNPDDPIALLNYALLHQCILREYYKAEKIYRRALAQGAIKEVVENYNLFLDQRYPGGFYANGGVPNVIVRRSEVKEERPEWGEWKIMLDPLCIKDSFNTFWLNSVDGSSSFKEPDWEDAWKKRVERSERLSKSSKGLWVEYYDVRLNAKFVFNRTSKEYVWVQNV